jgi:OOP family OmpA-OmpF porin
MEKIFPPRKWRLSSKPIKSQLSKKDRTLNKQAMTIENNEDKINRQDHRNQMLMNRNSKLLKKQILDDKFKSARAAFTTNEADVFRQGNNLIINLKSLSFSPGQSTLDARYFPLLVKVQNVISEFGRGQVLVEGHTDSKGNKKLNDRLSDHRADAVKQYLISNHDVADPELSIQSIGYGDEKPLVSNKTQTGRAKNRRVDIVIYSDQI